jgi:hypothetical protein
MRALHCGNVNNELWARPAHSRPHGPSPQNFPSGPRQPRFEVVRRRLVPIAEAFDSIWIEDGYGPMYRRILVEAALPVGP